MAKGCERIFVNMPYWGHIISTIKTKIGQENRTIHTEKWWIVQNGPRQQTMAMFDNYKNTNGDEKITWTTNMKAFCNWNNTKKDIRC